MNRVAAQRFQELELAKDWSLQWREVSERTLAATKATNELADRLEILCTQMEGGYEALAGNGRLMRVRPKTTYVALRQNPIDRRARARLAASYSASGVLARACARGLKHFKTCLNRSPSSGRAHGAKPRARGSTGVGIPNGACTMWGLQGT